MDEKELNNSNQLEEEATEEVQEVDNIEKNISQEIIHDIDEQQIEKVDKTYTGKNIAVLEGLEAVRKRPGMYIGSTSATGLHHLIWEIVDNAIEECLAGHCASISVQINKDNSITVSDNGRGIPVDNVEKTNRSAVETVYTVLHAGGKFDNGGYKVSGGLHGVGASVVNALSTFVDVTVRRDGGVYYIRFENGGHTVAPLKRIGDCSIEEHGTTVTFKPDPTIFTETTIFDFDTVNTRIRQMAFLSKGIHIKLSDLREEPPIVINYKFDGGIKEYVEFLNKSAEKELVIEMHHSTEDLDEMEF